MNPPLITIIIPAYNTSIYLSRCLESIVAQTYTNLEIIVIDDGSTDKTKVLLDEWVKKDCRIKAIYQQNQGLAEVCNIGVKEANAAFIGFVDSDDWIDPIMFEELYLSMENNSTDIAVCGVFLETEDGKLLKRRGCKKNKIDYRKTALTQILIDKKEINYRWNKLYRKELFDGIIFPKNRVFEDLNTVYKLYARACKVSFVGKDLYHYIQRSESIIGTRNPRKEFDFFLANAERYDFISKHPDFSKYERKMLQIRTLKRLLSSSNKVYKMTSVNEFFKQKQIIIDTMQKIHRANFTFDKYSYYILQNYFYSIPYLFKFI